MNGQFGGRVALITGAGSGIGRASAVAFAREGANVIVGDISSEAAQATLATITSSGGIGQIVEMDVSNNDSVVSCFRMLDQVGLVADIVVNCAGIAFSESGIYESGDGAIHTVPEAIWDRTLEVNLKGTYLVCKNAIERLVNRGGGCLINIASLAALKATSHHAYSASKGGVVALSRAIGVTYASQGIRCNAIAPGAIDTPMMERVLSDQELRAKRMEPIPAGRPGRPEEVAALAVFLASEGAAYITGTVISVDGGASAL